MVKENKCNYCNKNLSYSERRDSYYCEHCDIWTEVKCTDIWDTIELCEYCTGRPDKPSQDME